jgi:Fur family transcriptional regulator, ferric uptake regulator
MADSKLSLGDFNLRPTACRNEVLSAFQLVDYALSQYDIVQSLSAQFDRVTIYRTLKTFLTQGLIHKVLDDHGSTKYALCKELCHQGEHVHQHDHVHFKCQSCGQTICLETVIIPAIPLPTKFIKQESNLLIQGICEHCNPII